MKAWVKDTTVQQALWSSDSAASKAVEVKTFGYAQKIRFGRVKCSGLFLDAGVRPVTDPSTLYGVLAILNQGDSYGDVDSSDPGSPIWTNSNSKILYFTLQSGRNSYPGSSVGTYGFTDKEKIDREIDVVPGDRICWIVQNTDSYGGAGSLHWEGMLALEWDILY